MNFDRDSDDPLLGMTLGGCLIEAVLGRGGMGSVYRARQLALDKTVALKLLAPHLCTEKDAVQRFLLEARAAAKIEHPNVVQVINIAEESGQHFIILQFVEGQSLEALLQKKGRLGLKAATRIARDVALGLEALHGEDIIHRDIKPANILIANDATVKITDFGLARNVRQEGGLTVQGAFMGTPEFVSPEQVQGSGVDHRTDLYALGVTYFLMLSGTLPFKGQSAIETASLHLRDEAPPLELRIPGADPRACAIVKKLLQKDPAARVQEARLLRAEFDEILAEAPGAAAPEPAPPPAPTPFSTAPTVPDIPVKGRRKPSAAEPEAAEEEEPLISSGPKRRVMADYGAVKPRDFVIPPPPKPTPKKTDDEQIVSVKKEEAPLPTLEELAKPRLHLAPPPPPPPPKAATAKRDPKTVIRKRAAWLGRNTLFWSLIAASWTLFFLTGALGTAVRGDSFWEGLSRPFTTSDGALLTRLSTLVLAVVGLVAAGFQNRREFEAAYSAGPALMLFVFGGLLVYVGALNLPVAPGTGSAFTRALAAAAREWAHPCHLFAVGVWGVITGLGLGSPRGAGRFSYAVGSLIVFISLTALAAFGADGALEGLFDRFRRPFGDGLPALAVFACAAVGLLMSFGLKRSTPVRGAGVTLVFLAAFGALVVGIWRSGPAAPPFSAMLATPFESLPEALLGHGGALTLGGLLGFWGGCLLYNKFTPAYSA